ncbi:hypothetical protein EG329_001703 [Mollisiaceae sp. DMI_Dod_QoI]|nr:hypothetical protein EG329_001703 [Helotiales sp. DMI_Dod_QoI]
MANRFATSFWPVPPLRCSMIFGLDVADMVKQTLDGNGVVIAATIVTAMLQSILNSIIKPASGSPVPVQQSVQQQLLLAKATTKATASASTTKVGITSSTAVSSGLAISVPATAKPKENLEARRLRIASSMPR